MTIAVASGGPASGQCPPTREYRLVRRPAEPATTLIADPVQAAVIGHTTGPLLVVGGPGTGKTTTLVEAVAARVAEGTPAERIAVFTFGRRGALRLRNRIETRLATVPGAITTITQPFVRTFHGYAFGLLRRAAAGSDEAPPRLLTGPEQDLIIRELLAGAGPDHWPESLRAALPTRAFARELRDLLLRCAERGIGPARLAALATALGRSDWSAAARFYSEYSQILALREASGRESVGYDYAELVRVAGTLLREDGGLLAAERERLAYVYVDELAETDPAQIELLAAIAGSGRHLVAFADPDSSIYTFRGADPGVVRDFPDRFHLSRGGPAPTSTLLRAYRVSADQRGAELLAATLRVARRLRGPARHRALVPAGPCLAGAGSSVERPAVTVRTFGGEASQAAFVASRLREAHLVQGVPWAEMAVIVRSAALDSIPIRRALHRAGIPVAARAVDRPLPLQPAVAPLLLALSCAVDPAKLDDEVAVLLLRSPIGAADPLAERRLRQSLQATAAAAGDRRPAGALLREALLDPERLAELDEPVAAPARAVATVLAAARQAAGRPGVEVPEVLWATWSGTGLAERWAEASALGGQRGDLADRDLDSVLALFESAETFRDRLPGAGLSVFLEYVEGQDVPADTLAPTGDRGAAVSVLTAHAAKGLEWDLVAVVGVHEGTWPDLRLRGTILGSQQLVDLIAGRELEDFGRLSALLDEERRLFYTATARARRALIVTAVQSGDGEGLPSRFLTELSGEPLPPPEGAWETSLTLPSLVAELRRAVVDQDQPDQRRRAAAALLRCLAEQGVRGADPDHWWGLVQLSDERPLRDLGTTITVTPSTVDSVLRCSLRWLLERHGGAAPATPEQAIGNLVHAAATLASDATVDRGALAAYVADRFEAIELSARWLAGREQLRVAGMLDKLLGWLAENPRRLVGIERMFLVALADPAAPIEIRGRVDRLEVDSAGRLFVVDLKTGRSAPTAAELGQHAQLAAYQVAVAAGAFPESSVPGGAALVQLGGPANRFREQVQPSFVEADDPEWAVDLIRQTARTMASSTFQAIANSSCRTCPVTGCCPVSGGRQVTDR